MRVKLKMHPADRRENIFLYIFMFYFQKWRLLVKVVLEQNFNIIMLDAEDIYESLGEPPQI